jgi:hypothetical protein
MFSVPLSQLPVRLLQIQLASAAAVVVSSGDITEDMSVDVTGRMERATARRGDDRLQEVYECCDHDYRNQVGAPHPQEAVRIGASGRSRPSRAYYLERVTDSYALQSAAWQASVINRNRDLSSIREDLHDEIFPQLPVAPLAQDYPKK